MMLWVCLTLSLASDARAQAAIGGSGSCTSTGGTDVLFLLDNSDSITTAEYATFASTVVSIGETLRAANPATRIGVAHYGGPYLSGVIFGQYVYFERNFSTAALSSPVRRFGYGGAFNILYAQDNLADAIFRMSYGLDGNAGTSSSYLVGPLSEMSRDLTRPLQIVAFTDAAYHLVGILAGSSIIDGPGYAAEPDDGSNFTIYNRLKAQGVKFSVAALSADPYQAERDPAAAAIASVGGAWMGAVAANAMDPEGSQTLPRRFVNSSNFILTPAQITSFVTPIANLCPPPTYDYGDAPASYGAPSHLIVSGGARLGSVGPDSEAAPHHSVDALGDDNNGVDDEDGVNFGTLSVGISSMVNVTLPWGISSGYVNAWADWNRDGDFLDAGEQIAVNLRDDGSGVDGTANDLQLQFLINVPTTAVAGQTYLTRFRLSTQANLAPDTGVAPDGEIEDHAVTVQAYTPPSGPPVGACAGPNLLVNGDFGTTSNWAVGYDTSRPSGGVSIGLAGVNSTLTGAPAYQDASGVFRSYVDTDGNLGGVPTLHLRNETLVNIVNGQNYAFSYDLQRIVNSASVNATIGWVLVHPTTNAIMMNIPGVSTTVASTPTSWTNHNVTFTAAIPSGSYKVAMTFKTAAVSTQVIDYHMDRVYFAPVYSCDYGDAPASYGAPMHVIAGGLKLGVNAPDAEAAAQHGALATGDDLNGVDDEDGVSSFPPLYVGATSYSIPAANLSATGTGVLHAWIDFDKNGAFTANERASVSVTGGVLAGPLSWTSITVGGAGPSYARLRFTSTSLIDDSATPALDERAATAVAFDGEVEDHAVSFVTPSLPPSASMAVCHQPAAASLANTMGTLWRHNEPPGTLAGEILTMDPSLPISNLVSASPLVFGPGLVPSRPDPNYTSYFLGHVSSSGAASAYAAQDYVSYSFTTAASLGYDRYLRNFMVHASSVHPTNLPFRTTILLSTDPNFSTATVVADSWLLQANPADDYPLKSADAPVLLAPSTTYYLRAIIHNATPSSGLVFWDDFIVLLASCADRSDAPASYGEARHAGDNSMRLGASRSVDPTDIASPDAMGDGATDDGVFLGPAASGVSLQGQTLTQGAPHLLEFAVTGSGGQLSGWIDADRDGVFSPGVETLFSDLVDGGPRDENPAPGLIRITITPPALSVGLSFLRFRWSSVPNLGPIGPALDGEVEDYAVTVQSDPRVNLPPFACMSRLYQVYGATGAISYMRLHDGALINVPYSVGQPANAAGYRLSDNLVYAVVYAVATDSSPRRLIAIGANGSHVELGPITGLPVNFAYQSGDFGGDGYLHVKSSEDTVVHRINVDTATVVSSYSVAGFPATAADIAYNPEDGYFYGVDRFIPQLWRFREGFPPTAIGAGEGYTSGGQFSWGATFVMNGRFFAANNRNGTVYEFNTTTGFASYIGFTVPNLSTNDGFSCNQAVFLPEGDLSITKDNGVSVLTPGQTTQYVLSVTNKQGATIIGAMLSDPAVAGLNKLSVSCSPTPGLCTTPPSVAELEAGSFTLPVMAEGDGYEIVVTAEVTAPAGVAVANAAYAIMPAEYVDLEPADNMARDVDPVGDFTLSPDHESTVPAGQIVMYRHELHVGSGMETGEVEFSLLSDQGLDWKIYLDRSETAPHAPDAIFGAGDTLLPSGPYALNGASALSVWLVAQVPQETPAGWRDLTRLTASWTQGASTQTAFVEDLTHVAGDEGQIVARKTIAPDLDCDGLADGAFTVLDVTIQPGACALYEIAFENLGTQPIREVKVHDETPDWTRYFPGSAQVMSHPASLTPQTPRTPAAWTEGAILFPFLGALQPGESGAVRFGVQLRSPSPGSGSGGEN